MKGLNSSEPRFCGPGMATAALVTRFNRGLPVPLQQLPATTKVVVLIRSPVDVVVARVQAKWVRGGPAWPSCTLRTIERCADELCGSMMQMLRTLPNSEDASGFFDGRRLPRAARRRRSTLVAWRDCQSYAVAELMIDVERAKGLQGAVR